MQQKKNIKLLILWVILLLVTVFVFLNKPDTNRLDIDKDHFSLKEKVNEVDKITIAGSLSNISLLKKGRQWSLNEEYTADPSKINDLLGILSEVSVRRKAATQTQSTLLNPESDHYKVNIYNGDQLIQAFEVAENKQGTLTYFIDEVAYVVNIPGYNYHIANIFILSTLDWRSPYVFASNWTTLDKMQINYPNDSINNFEIVYNNSGYIIPTIDKLDSVAMYNYMEQVSFLQVQAYLPAIDSISKPADLNITILDVGDQQMRLDFYIYEKETLGHINNEEWAFFNKNQVNLLLKSRHDFTTRQ